MEMKDLDKSQLILLAILLSFVTSIATGITTVSLMQRAPSSITVPINRVIQQTVEKIAPSVVNNPDQVLSEDQKKLLEELKAIKPLTVTLYFKGATVDQDKILGTGLFLGDNKVVIASLIDVPKEGETYVVKSVLGEQKVSKVTQEKDFTIIELVQIPNVPAENPTSTITTPPTTDSTTVVPAQ